MRFPTARRVKVSRRAVWSRLYTILAAKLDQLGRHVEKLYSVAWKCKLGGTSAVFRSSFTCGVIGQMLSKIQLFPMSAQCLPTYLPTSAQSRCSPKKSSIITPDLPQLTSFSQLLHCPRSMSSQLIIGKTLMQPGATVILADP